VPAWRAIEPNCREREVLSLIIEILLLLIAQTLLSVVMDVALTTACGNKTAIFLEVLGGT
jgi:hypothetical protein